MIAILTTEVEAIELSENIHQFLIENRPGYNATNWCDVNKGDKEEWIVKIPSDYQKWDVKLDIKSIKTTKDEPEIGEVFIKDEYYLIKGSVFKCELTETKTVDSIASLTPFKVDIV